MNIKVCTKCGESKSLEDYHYRDSSKTKMYSHCKKCHTELVCGRYIVLKNKAIEYKGGCCKVCGYKKYYGALQFHHRDPLEKEYSWKELRKKSWKTIIEELDKCDLLCANCHFEEHDRIRTKFYAEIA